MHFVCTLRSSLMACWNLADPIKASRICFSGMKERAILVLERNIYITSMQPN